MVTREEIQAEINKLRDEHRIVMDNLKDAIRSLPECRRDDQRERKQLFRSGNIIGSGINHADLLREQRMNNFISEYRQKRDELKTRIERLNSQLRMQPGPTTTDAPRLTGTVKWYNEAKGFGFIRVNNPPDVFVHKSSLMESTSLREGDKVTFKQIRGSKGIQAVDVRYYTE